MLFVIFTSLSVPSAVSISSLLVGGHGVTGSFLFAAISLCLHIRPGPIPLNPFALAVETQPVPTFDGSICLELACAASVQLCFPSYSESQTLQLLPCMHSSVSVCIYDFESLPILGLATPPSA